jgi:hypothetical protein
MPKHTPGPWSIGKHSSVIVANDEFNDDPDGVVQYYGGDVICESMCKEDAHLIAAAPELLEVCEGIIMFPDVKYCLMEKFPGLVTQIETAIAKAKGETNGN